jgi:hypothetical protein
MNSSNPAQRAARRRGEHHRDGGDRRIRGAIAARQRLSTGRLSMPLPPRPVRGGDVHAQAIERLNVAVDDRERVNEESDAAQGGLEERSAVVALAAANERVAAREAWVKYVEHGY